MSGTMHRLFQIYLLIILTLSYTNQIRVQEDPECLFYHEETKTMEECNETKHGFRIDWVVPPYEIYAGERLTTTLNIKIVSDEFYKQYWNGTVKNTLNAKKNWTEVKTSFEERDTECREVLAVEKYFRACMTQKCLSKAESCSLLDLWKGRCMLEHYKNSFTNTMYLNVGPHGTNTSCPHSEFYTPVNMSVHTLLKLGGFEMWVTKHFVVKPQRVCGDTICELELLETCDTCPMDCGRCPLRAWQIGLIVGFSILGFLLVVAVILYIRAQRRKRLYDESWLIPFAEIQEGRSRQGKSGSRMSMGSMFSTASMGGAAAKQVFVKIALVQGRTAAVRVVNKKEFSLTMPIRKEVRAVRACDQANVCKFIGASVTLPNIWVLTEYCAKGNISDVLLNEEIPLNWAFRFSFAVDIAKGMNYLHSKGIMHGRLKSNNCIVDDRWTVKITDFGLKILRKNDEIIDKENDEIKERRAIIYVAPEHMGMKKFEPTQEGDVYAYAIILIEIATRQEPFGDMDMFSERKSWKPPIPDLSPKAGEKEEDHCPCPEEYLQLINDCWADDPKSRPTFGAIGKRVVAINPNKLSAVDLMMLMMEKYSKHLEAIVAERTKDLVAEKAKTDRLLYSMLPMAVANELRQGRPVEARYYNGCTIYFSDIVGFTVISGGSTAIQVVNLLNKLYITFDEIIDDYNVYKVETIGDAYMVVSGIPVETPVHAQQVANMAIDIVDACTRFVIPHMPEQPLKIRVGLHSGQACAGVVGLKMPRYCLFGDTVNTASRMESNGEAYKIHISNFTYEELVKTNQYIMELRGTIPIKGKGDMTTWWLKGYDPQYMAERAKLKEQTVTKPKKKLKARWTKAE
ncbi:speract receptor-like isoform X4 [Dreissena polymorpha]|uniref:speract receptor-like isoform X3 n=1 Tax=Dreissena polymorpha TaxID=45954 RepID=UPI0022643B6F|nr:speract receptor-like isoform X3 [Dreissena polymorpha]XP_052256192.1 speract receptor-like isoform X4 [Dreissena polymorpha]